MIRLTNHSTELSIAKEVMSAKREMKKNKISTKKKNGARIQPLNVDKFSNPT